MSIEILKILQKFLMHVVVGSKTLDETKITIMLKKVNDSKYTPYECSTLSEALALLAPEFVGETDRSRLMNPLWHLMYKATGKCYGFTE